MQFLCILRMEALTILISNSALNQFDHLGPPPIPFITCMINFVEMELKV